MQMSKLRQEGCGLELEAYWLLRQACCKVLVDGETLKSILDRQLFVHLLKFRSGVRCS
jgi:hypothetical protein